MANVKKAQKGMTMKQLKMKYPDVDTTARGDVRGSEMNAYAPKKELKKYNDTYNAFDRKYKGGSSDVKMSPAKIKKSQNGSAMPKPSKPKPSMKMGGTLAPTKKSVGKTIGKLNKAKSGMKMSKMSKKK